MFLRRLLRLAGIGGLLVPALWGFSDQDGASAGAPAPYADVPRLSPKVPRLDEITIHDMPGQKIFDTLAKYFDLTVIFDPALQATGKNFNLHLVDKTAEEAFDAAAVMTRWFWKPLSPNSIFVTQDNQQNRHEFEDQALGAFYLHNVTNPQELAEILNVLRTMLDLRRVLAYTPQNAVFVRGNAGQVAAARKLIEDMDKPKSEVVIDVVVMETSRTRSRQISTALSGGAALGIPVTVTPRGAISGEGGRIPLPGLKHLSSADFSVVLPGLNLALDASDSQTRILQSPQVRTSDGQKAFLKIGHRVPYASGSFSNAATPVAGGAIVNTQFSYSDIGVNLELIPHVHGREELTLRIDLEISSVADHADIGGISEPVIGQRRVGHEVRLKEGHATVLAGLAETQDSKQVNGLPGLINIPVLRRIFGSDRVDRTHTDLLIVLVPHIVTTPEYTPSNLRPIFIGSDTNVRVRRGERD